MPRSTKASAALARELGVSPSRVQGWSEGGFEPAQDVTHKELLAHYRALDPLTGTGRSADVATIKMAAQGFHCERLRATLKRLRDLEEGETFDDADELAEAVDDRLRGFLEDAAAGLGAPPEYRKLPAEPALASVRAGAALLSLAQVAVGEPTEDDDFAEFDMLLNERTARIAEVPVSDVEMDSAVTAAVSRRIVEVVREIRPWLDEAADDELVPSVQAARRTVDALKIFGVQFGSDEEEWVTVGQLTPIAPRMSAGILKAYDDFYFPLAAGKAVPALERSFVEALTGKAISTEPSTYPELDSGNE